MVPSRDVWFVVSDPASLTHLRPDDGATPCPLQLGLWSRRSPLQTAQVVPCQHAGRIDQWVGIGELFGAVGVWDQASGPTNRLPGLRASAIATRVRIARRPATPQG